jgi:hypothetical protein
MLRSLDKGVPADVDQTVIQKQINEMLEVPLSLNDTEEVHRRVTRQTCNITSSPIVCGANRRNSSTYIAPTLTRYNTRSRGFPKTTKDADELFVE